MKAEGWICAGLCLASAACSFDLVDPAPDRSDARLSVFLDARDWAVGEVLVSGSLHPGVDAEGREEGVADPHLVLLDTTLRPDTVYEGGRLVLRWEDTLDVSEPRPERLRLVSPRMEDGLPPLEFVLPLKTVAAGQPIRTEWSVGEDLVLPLSPTPIDGDVAVSAQWHVQVQGWLESGARIHLLSLDAVAVVPDTIRILGSWLPSVAIDSLEVALQYDRHFRNTRPDSTFSLSVRLAEQLEWFFLVRRP